MRIAKAAQALLLAIIALGAPLRAHPGQVSAPNVWLVTLDGVRWQDVFKDKTIFKNLHQLTKKGFLVGDKDAGDRVSVSNGQNVSLPAYHSIMTGLEQYSGERACGGNECGRVKDETLFERLVREKKWGRHDTVALATWEKIPLSLEKAEGVILSNAGQKEFNSESADLNGEVARINREQMKTPSLVWNEVRWDRFTHAHAIQTISTKKPRFMYVAYGDADLWAHENDRGNYISTLKGYDKWIADLVALKDSLGAYGKNTTIIVTTDHGRGSGDMWKEHGPELPEASDIWMAAIGRGVTKIDSKARGTRFAHIDLRPTIEKLFGLKPLQGPGRGKPIAQIVP